MTHFDIHELGEYLKNDEDFPPLNVRINPIIERVFNAIDSNGIITNLELLESGLLNLSEAEYTTLQNTLRDRISYSRSTYNMTNQQREEYDRQRKYTKVLAYIEDMCTKIIDIPSVISNKEETILL